MNLLKHQIATSLAKCDLVTQAGLDTAALEAALTTPPKPELGDYALGLFPLAKALGTSPVQLGATLVEQANTVANAPWDEVTQAGPYANFRMNAVFVASAVLAEVAKRSCGDAPNTWHFGENSSGKQQTVAIDYSSPNIAKPLGVHHLRSTMIGNSLKKIYEANGYEVVGINHLGDWGTSFGKLIAALCENRPDVARAMSQFETDVPADELFKDLSIAELNRMYVEFSARAKADPMLENAGKDEFRALELGLSSMGDALSTGVITSSMTRSLRNFSIWEQIRKISLREFERVYATLGLQFTPYPFGEGSEAEDAFTSDRAAFLKNTGIYTGESYYIAGANHCRRIVDLCMSAGITEMNDGALVIYTDGKDQPPIILLKDDGATSYHTRDMAAAVYRSETFGAAKLIYVVGGEQKLHFRQLFKALEMLGYTWAKDCAHVDFGLVLAKDETTGRWGKFSTRQGRVVLLHELLEEAIEKVRGVVAEKNPELAADKGKLTRIAEAVGVGAVVFNDLKNGRRSDVKFDWDEMLSFNGETGPYILYQYVRLCSLLRRFQAEHGDRTEGDPSLLSHEKELALLKAIAAFPETVARACREDEPSLLARYALDLAAEFSSYWTATKETGIVGSDRALSKARIALVEALRKVLGKCLLLLGLRLVEEM